ncbi:MAG: CRISPR-associated endonuclease Cas1 [Candidatus Wallbacteria bacterium]|nr:CRISPR-associated endonuclease Cas1 [Candidatus Wallbacteria bacterium]
MQLVIATNGAYLHEKQGLFEIRTPERSVEFSAVKVSSIVIGSAASLSTGAIRLAVENNIDILFLDKFGEPFARAWHCGFGSTAAIRREQMRWAEGEEGGSWVVEQIGSKIGEQRKMLEELLRRRSSAREEQSARLAELADLQARLEQIRGVPEAIRSEVFALEAQAGKTYFEALADIVPEAWRFRGRSRRPARDGFNAFLNYAYGVLYGLVDRCAVLAGLDPHLGLLHTDGYGRPSLVFDLIEPYRAWADHVVMTLTSTRRAHKEMLREVPGGLALDKPGKVLLLEALNAYLDEVVRLDGRQRSRRCHVQYRMHGLANRLLGRKEREIEVTEV